VAAVGSVGAAGRGGVAMALGEGLTQAGWLPWCRGWPPPDVAPGPGRLGDGGAGRGRLRARAADRGPVRMDARWAWRPSSRSRACDQACPLVLDVSPSPYPEAAGGGWSGVAAGVAWWWWLWVLAVAGLAGFRAARPHVTGPRGRCVSSTGCWGRGGVPWALAGPGLVRGAAWHGRRGCASFRPPFGYAAPTAPTPPLLVSTLSAALDRVRGTPRPREAAPFRPAPAAPTPPRESHSAPAGRPGQACPQPAARAGRRRARSGPPRVGRWAESARTVMGQIDHGQRDVSADGALFRGVCPVRRTVRGNVDGRGQCDWRDVASESHGWVAAVGEDANGPLRV